MDKISKAAADYIIRAINDADCDRQQLRKIVRSISDDTIYVVGNHVVVKVTKWLDGIVEQVYDTHLMLYDEQGNIMGCYDKNDCVKRLDVPNRTEKVEQLPSAEQDSQGVLERIDAIEDFLWLSHLRSDDISIYTVSKKLNHLFTLLTTIEERAFAEVAILKKEKDRRERRQELYKQGE